MTKLTTQEIEQERVKFEEWFRVHWAKKKRSLIILKSFNSSKYSPYGYYDNFATNENFKNWIARAELKKKKKKKRGGIKCLT